MDQTPRDSNSPYASLHSAPLCSTCLSPSASLYPPGPSSLPSGPSSLPSALFAPLSPLRSHDLSPPRSRCPCARRYEVNRRVWAERKQQKQEAKEKETREISADMRAVLRGLS